MCTYIYVRNSSIVGFGSEETKRHKSPLRPDPPRAQIHLVITFVIAFVMAFVMAFVITFVIAFMIAILLAFVITCVITFVITFVVAFVIAFVIQTFGSDQLHDMIHFNIRNAFDLCMFMHRSTLVYTYIDIYI